MPATKESWIGPRTGHAAQQQTASQRAAELQTTKAEVIARQQQIAAQKAQQQQQQEGQTGGWSSVLDGSFEGQMTQAEKAVMNIFSGWPPSIAKIAKSLRKGMHTLLESFN